MNELYISVVQIKIYLTSVKAGLAWRRGNKDKIKELDKAYVILSRMNARAMVESFNLAVERLCAVKRLIKRGKKQGVSIPLLEEKAKILSEKRDEAPKQLILAGETVSNSLDLWQLHGATLQELCNLCNRDYEQVCTELLRDPGQYRFSELIFIYNLDYKGTGDFLNFEVDAPLTHSIKEYMMDNMLNTEDGQEAATNGYATEPDRRA